MYLYINTDTTVRSGGRSAVNMTQEELKEALLNKALSICQGTVYYDYIQEELQSNDEDNLMHLVVSTIIEDGAVEKDIKFNVSNENVLCEANMGGMMGFHTLANGLTFYGFHMGGDWEHPVFMILYHDGKKIRLYIPTCGNAVNLDCKCALGSEEDSENVDLCKLEKDYKSLGIWIPENDRDDLSHPFASMYVAKYGINRDWTVYDGLAYEWSLIQKDIESRIKVTGSFAAKPKQTKKTVTTVTQSNGAPVDEIIAACPHMPNYIKEFLYAIKDNPDKDVRLIVDCWMGRVEFSYENKTLISACMPGYEGPVLLGLKTIHFSFADSHIQHYHIVIK